MAGALYFPPEERDWRGREGPRSTIFGLQHVGYISGYEATQHKRVVELLARIVPGAGANPTSERELDFRTVVWPGAARGRGSNRERVSRFLLGQVRLYGGAPEMLERAAAAYQEELWSLLREWLPEHLFRPLDDEDMIRAALAPFPIGSIVELMRGKERWCGGEAPAELLGTLDADRMTQELRHCKGPSVLAVRLQPVRVTGTEIWRAEQELLGEHGRRESGSTPCGEGLLRQRDALTRLDVAGRLRELHYGAFRVAIQLASGDGLPERVCRALEREANVPRARGADDEAQRDAAEGGACMQPLNRPASPARDSELALVVRNLERMEQNRWWDIAGKHAEDSVSALAELAGLHEAARLFSLPGGV